MQSESFYMIPELLSSLPVQFQVAYGSLGPSSLTRLKHSPAGVNDINIKFKGFHIELQLGRDVVPPIINFAPSKRNAVATNCATVFPISFLHTHTNRIKFRALQTYITCDILTSLATPICKTLYNVIVREHGSTLKNASATCSFNAQPCL